MVEDTTVEEVVMDARCCQKGYPVLGTTEIDRHASRNSASRRRDMVQPILLTSVMTALITRFEYLGNG